MKNTLLILLTLTTLSYKAQTYALRSYFERPENSYLKDTNNEFSAYKGSWNNKTIYVTFKKITHKYESYLKEYRDILIAKFKVTDLNGNILFNNTNLLDDEAKIKGAGFQKTDDKYSLVYIDMDLCGRSGRILINFTDSTKTQLKWGYRQSENWLEPDCFYYNYLVDERPQPLPNNIVLVKQ